MTIFICYLLSFLKDFFVVKFGVISAFEVEHPALYFIGLGVNLDQLFQFFNHPEVLGSECPFNW
jgi:hypothetical protein